MFVQFYVVLGKELQVLRVLVKHFIIYNTSPAHRLVLEMVSHHMAQQRHELKDFCLSLPSAEMRSVNTILDYVKC